MAWPRLLRKNIMYKNKNINMTIDKVFDDSHSYCSMYKCIVVSDYEIKTIFLTKEEINRINKVNGHKSPLYI